MIGAHRGVQISTVFGQHQAEPDGDHSSGDPWVEVCGVIIGTEVDRPARMKAAQTGSRSIAGLTQS